MKNVVCLAYEKTNLFIGALAYVIGIIFVNLFIGDFEPVFYFPIWAELTIICLGVMSMSIFFYSRFSYLLLFITGIYLGTLLKTLPPFVLLALIPITIAHWTGIEIGVCARQDFFGKRNFFEEKEKFALMILAIVIASAAIGFLPDLLPSYFRLALPI